MILCVTLNPCLDKTLTVPAWRPGDNVRGSAASEVVGGKGNNVARALKRLGRDARPVTFLGGAVGARCEDLLRRQDGFDPIIVRASSETRTILTVRGPENDATAFFDPDPEITEAEADSLRRAVEAELAGGSVQALTLSGSSPGRATHALYSDLISVAKPRRVPVFLDTYGPALDEIWGFRPDYLQLNRREASAYLKKPQASDADLLKMLDDWGRRGVRCALATDGSRPVLARYQGVRYQVTPPEITPVNPIGSGDCLLAGLVDALLDGREPADALKRAVALGVANALVWDAGSFDPDGLREIENRVIVETSA